MEHASKHVEHDSYKEIHLNKLGGGLTDPKSVVILGMAWTHEDRLAFLN